MAILVGGTGLYFKAYLEGLGPAPPRDDKVRADLESTPPPQLLEELADATVLLARVGYTTRAALQRAYKLLLMHRKDPAKPAIGVLLNFVPRRSSAHYGYYGYYGGKKYQYQQG